MLNSTPLRAAAFILLDFGSILASQAEGAPEPSCQPREIERTVEGLLLIRDFGDTYIEDGAADGSITVRPPRYVPPACLQRILECPESSAPVLIRHLSDTRLTSANLKTIQTSYKPRAATLGYVCLDILLVISARDSPVVVQDCEDDGLGACVTERYYFRPDDYDMRLKHYVPREVVARVKRAWEKALKAGALHFEYPSWLEGGQILWEQLDDYGRLGYKSLLPLKGTLSRRDVRSPLTGHTYNLEIRVQNNDDGKSGLWILGNISDGGEWGHVDSIVVLPDGTVRDGGWGNF